MYRVRDDHNMDKYLAHQRAFARFRYGLNSRDTLGTLSNLAGALKSDAQYKQSFDTYIRTINAMKLHLPADDYMVITVGVRCCVAILFKWNVLSLHEPCGSDSRSTIGVLQGFVRAVAT